MGHFLQNTRSKPQPSRVNSTSSMGSQSGSGVLGQSTTGVPIDANVLVPQHLSAESVAALPPPGLSGPSSLVFSPKSPEDGSGHYLAFVSSSVNHRRSSARASSSMSSTTERQLFVMDLSNISSFDPKRRGSDTQQSHSSQLSFNPQPLLRLPYSNSSHNSTNKRRMLDGTRSTMSNAAEENIETSASSNISSSAESMSLEERLRRERQRTHASTSIVQFSWGCCTKIIDAAKGISKSSLRLLVPLRGSLYVQNGVLSDAEPLQLAYDKNRTQTTNSFGGTPDAVDPQLSPDGSMVAFVIMGEIYVTSAETCSDDESRSSLGNAKIVQITYGATETISHGIADFVAQEEMDRYRGFWWRADSSGIVFTRLDESKIPTYRIIHQDTSIAAAGPTTHSGSTSSEDVSGFQNGASSSGMSYEDHRYPFAGKDNPDVKLGYVRVHKESILKASRRETPSSFTKSLSGGDIAIGNWNDVQWYDPPREAPEYLARLSFMPDGSACAQWQNRSQNCLVLVRMDLDRHKSRPLLVERTNVWINLHHMLTPLPRAVHPDSCGATEKNIPPVPKPLPESAFSFLFASERTGYCHLYLYTFVPGINGDQAILIRAVSGREWIVESVAGVDMDRDIVYFTGTYDSPLERHLYALPITNGGVGGHDQHEQSASSPEHADSNPNGVRRGLKQVMNALSGKSRSRNNDTSSSHYLKPHRLTSESGMHNIVMDADCELFVDTSSDVDRPTTVSLYQIPRASSLMKMMDNGTHQSKSSRYPEPVLLCTLYDALQDDKSLTAMSDSAGTTRDSTTSRLIANLPAPEFLSFPTSDGTETLHAAMYRPDPRIHGPGPYPVICAVYGGPHVQRVNRSWSQCADMRAQRLRSLGFCVVKCDNRGSSRRGLAFESAISRRLGRLEVLDQAATVRQLILRGIADANRVGIYGWSYGGYLSAMCLCRAPDVFHVAVAGAPVTSWDGYDTHYTERYMGLPTDNPGGYRESAVFDHVPHMRGKLLIVHGLIDENVHFRHTARLINRLIASGKDYDLLIFPDERHSPRRLRDRIYMEQRISDYFLRHLGGPTADIIRSANQALRTVAGHL